MGKTLNFFTWLFTALVTIGALAWGIYGINGFLLVDYLFRFNWLIKTVYVLVGISGLLLVPSVLAMIWKARRG